MEVKKINLAQTDSPYFPKLKTKSYLVPPKRINDIDYFIKECNLFGKLGPGDMGSHPIELNYMHYGGNINIPYLTEWRTIRDTKRTPLSIGYFFEKNNVPLNLFLLVKKPWVQLITGKQEKYLIYGYLRSPKKEILPEAKINLEKILKVFKISS